MCNKLVPNKAEPMVSLIKIGMIELMPETGFVQQSGAIKLYSLASSSKK